LTYFDNDVGQRPGSVSYGLKQNAGVKLLSKIVKRRLAVFCSSKLPPSVPSGVARFFGPNGKNIPNDRKLYQTAANLTKGP
jgi:hypothetical protein